MNTTLFPPRGDRRRARHIRTSSLATALAVLLLQAPLHGEVARRADSFVDSIGVNTHFGVGGTYAMASNTADRLVESGIRYIRNNRRTMPSLVPHGIQTLVVIDTNTIPLNDIIDMLEEPGVLGIEGFNEPDNFPRAWNGIADDKTTRDYSGARAFQRDIYDAAKSSQAKLKPILAPGMGSWRQSGTVTPLPFDKLSLHSYSWGRNPGFQSLDLECIPYAAQMIAPGQSPQGIWVTEAGFNNAIDSTQNHRPVTETAAGKYIPRMLALNFNRWIEKTFIYELIDTGPNDATTWDMANPERNFGLLRHDRSAKPAFWALKNLISLLSDTGSQTFSPGALNITLSGDTTDLNRTLLQKSNGDYYLLLWKEALSCDRDVTPPVDLSVAPASVTVNFGSTAQSVTLYGDLTNPQFTSLAQGTFTNVGSLQVDVPDEVVILKISGIANAGTGVPAAPAGADLVIDNAWTVPAEPVADEPTALWATFENRGTEATSGSSIAKLRLNGHPNDHAVRFIVPALAAGERINLQGVAGTPPTAATWTAGAAGRHHFSLKADAESALSETNINNNGYLLTVPVLSGRWIDACDSFANWTASDGNWTINSGGGRTFFANSSKHAAGTLTHTLPQQLASDWHLDFDYGWHFGSGAYNLSVMADVLTSSNNGYRIRVRQGVISNPADSSNVGKLIQLFRVANGVAATTPLAEGPGYNLPGDQTSGSFLPVRLVFDRAAQSLSVYVDLNGDGVWEQSIPPVRDTVAPVRDFDKIVLSAHDGQGAHCRPKFDNIRLSRGMIDLAPAPYLADSFVDLSQWTSVTNWAKSTSGDYIQNIAQYAAGTLTHPFPATLKDSWTVGFDYDFRWGGAGSGQSLKWGHHNLQVHADMVNSAGDGYRVVVRQGDSNNPALHGKIIQLVRLQNGNATVLAEGVGYNTPGWLALGRARPDFKRVVLNYDRATQRLSVLADLNRDGVLEEVIAPKLDATFTQFQKLVLGAHDAQGGTPGVGPCLDNVTVGLIR